MDWQTRGLKSHPKNCWEANIKTRFWWEHLDLLYFGMPIPSHSHFGFLFLIFDAKEVQWIQRPETQAVNSWRWHGQKRRNMIYVSSGNICCCDHSQSHQLPWGYDQTSANLARVLAQIVLKRKRVIVFSPLP